MNEETPEEKAKELVDQLKEYDFSPRDNTYIIKIPVWIWKELNTLKKEKSKK